MAWAIAVKNGKHSERRGDDEESDEEEILIASAIFMAFVSTVFAGWYLRSDDNWGYYRDLHGDCSYYDRDRYYDHDRDWRDDLLSLA